MVTREAVRGHLRFENVHFRYPTRPGVRVLRNLNLDVKPGQFVALVGGSGCGKSTTIQVSFSIPAPYLRFFDAEPLSIS
jgi:ATP-binding cassette subfamily B (MDR/TAP) protein 1